MDMILYYIVPMHTGRRSISLYLINLRVKENPITLDTGNNTLSSKQIYFSQLVKYDIFNEGQMLNVEWQRSHIRKRIYKGGKIK